MFDLWPLKFAVYNWTASDWVLNCYPLVIKFLWLYKGFTINIYPYVGYKTYIGYLFLEHTHANPVLFTFNRLMWEAIQKNDDDLVIESKELDDKSEHEENRRKARIRWFLAVTLVNNPDLVELRRRETQKVEEVKGGCVIKQFKSKVVRKIDAIRDNCEQKRDTAF